MANALSSSGAFSANLGVIDKQKQRAAMSMHRVSEHREEDEDDYENERHRRKSQHEDLVGSEEIAGEDELAEQQRR